MAAVTITNLTASASVADVNDEITFTWKWNTEPVDEFESVTNNRRYKLECLNPDGGLVTSHAGSATSFDSPSAKMLFKGCSYDPYYLEFRVYAIAYDAADLGDPSAIIGGPSNAVRVYDSRMPSEPTPPAPDTGARLEQFQNSAGADIYPKTVVEGVFRQSDGKTLQQLLADTQAGAVPTSRKVNGQTLDQDITLITCGTTDLTAGTSKLAAGTLYGVYEV